MHMRNAVPWLLRALTRLLVMRLIGLTGGIASGKSTVSNLLREQGVPVVDADEIAREVVKPGRRPYQRIVKEFGLEVLQNGQLGAPIDRERLGALIFKNPSKRRRLNAITHPAVVWTIATRLGKLFLQGEPAAVLDVPLLYETGMHRMVSNVVVVWVDEQTQLKRLTVRDHKGDAAALERIHIQESLEDKKAKADYIIDNTGSRLSTAEQVVKLCKELDIGRASKQAMEVEDADKSLARRGVVAARGAALAGLLGVGVWAVQRGVGVIV
eukprot:jgi/Chlat1/4033/Chrsp26S04094